MTELIEAVTKRRLGDRGQGEIAWFALRASPLLAIFGLVVLAGSCGIARAQERAVYLDPAQPIDRRVDDLVSRMTLEEKASQLVNRTRAVPRLGVPEYNLWSEALHGVANNGIATVFPQAIGLAATFDAPLLHEMAKVVADEARAKHHQFLRQGRRGRYQGLTFWSPNINIFRDPRWGRGQETYGEDPYLTGRLGVAFITGLQGSDPEHPVVTATAKHYAVHSGPEPLRHGFDAKASPHDIEDTYLPAFRDAVGFRPDVDRLAAQVRINLRIVRDEAVLSLDLSGESLNRRGYRTGPAQASLVPILVQQFGWIPALATGSVFGLVSALLWLFIQRWFS